MELSSLIILISAHTLQRAAGEWKQTHQNFLHYPHCLPLEEHMDGHHDGDRRIMHLGKKTIFPNQYWNLTAEFLIFCSRPLRTSPTFLRLVTWLLAYFGGCSNSSVFQFPYFCFYCHCINSGQCTWSFFSLNGFRKDSFLGVQIRIIVFFRCRVQILVSMAM